MTQRRLAPIHFLLLCFVGLALLYSYAVPIFEAPDELYHVGMIHHLAQTGQLPIPIPFEDTIYRQEGSQPPLYYLIGAALVSPIPRDDFMTVRRFNPHGILGVPGLEGNKNRIVHDAPSTPALHGTVLAVYAVRLFSILLGTITVTAVYACACLIAPQQRKIALLAAAFTAFNPQFLFISASVNNDNLVTALNSVILWQVLLMLRDGFKTNRSLFIAVLVALATLSKLGGLVMVPVVALAGLYVAVRDRNLRGVFILGTFMLAAWMLLAGWWYLRNILLYQELFGTRHMLDVYGRREPIASLGEWLRVMWGEFGGLRRSYWAVFGWFSIETIAAFYVVMDVISAFAFTGFGVYLWLIRKNRAQGVRLFFVCFMLTLGLGGFLSWTTQVPASQGRLLFPYIASSSTIMALGLSAWSAEVKGNRRFFPIMLIVGFLGAFATAVPFITLMPEYAPPSSLGNLPETAVPVDARFGDILLLGYQAPDRRYLPGDDIPITLYWQPLAQTDLDYSLSLSAYLPDGAVIGKLDTYPGWGTLRTSQWEAGRMYADSYRLSLDESALGDGVVRVRVGWWVYPTGQTLPLTNLDGQALDGIALDTGGFSDGVISCELCQDGTCAESTQNACLGGIFVTEPVTFGRIFRLLAYRLEENQLTLTWEVLYRPVDDYTVFAQVIDPAHGLIIGQGDAPPLLPTHYLRPGEYFATQHTLVYLAPPAAGTYPLVIGWYNATDRLQIAPYGDSYLLTEVTVSQ